MNAMARQAKRTGKAPQHRTYLHSCDPCSSQGDSVAKAQPHVTGRSILNTLPEAQTREIHPLPYPFISLLLFNLSISMQPRLAVGVQPQPKPKQTNEQTLDPSTTIHDVADKMLF
jgi:hypothetical protein